MARKKLRSIADLARLAGVSKATVSRALSGSRLVREETGRRIQELARQHDFWPSAAARSLSLRSSRTIAFVTHAYSKADCGISDPFSLEILGGIAIGLHELGYDLLVVHMAPEESDWISRYLESGSVDGFILMTSAMKRQHVNLLLDKGAPFIAWGQGNGRYCSVCGDNRRGGRLAAERLLSQGRKRITFIGGPRVEAEVQDRFRGYEAALKEAGRSPDPGLVVHGDFSERSGARAMEELLAREPKLDAVFACSDLMAIAAMRVLQASGRRVPEEVAVIGYDDLALAGYVSPPLTTISQQIPRAGRLLARDLVAYLKEGITTTTVVPVELVARSSG
jgi:DNA-binding LacI/PurR family transcriptional regulator